MSTMRLLVTLTIILLAVIYSVNSQNGNKGGGNNGGGNKNSGGTKQSDVSSTPDQKKPKKNKEREDVKKLNGRVKQRKNADWKGKKDNWKAEQKKKPKKRNKDEKKRKADKVVWKGKVRNEEQREEKTPKKQKKVKKNKSCVAEGTALPDLKGKPSLGPKADGVDPASFKLCDKRKRGGESKGKKGAVKRRKRSESYASTDGLWDDPTAIPVTYNVNFPSENRANIQTALEMWEKYTCVKFVDAANPLTTSPYIEVSGGDEAACGTEWLGPNKESFKTDVYVNLCKDQNGTLCHEFGHLLGLTHSQKRSDRDEYVNIHLENVRDGLEFQFEKNDYDEFGSFGVPYYFDSIMHYAPQGLTKDGRTTTCPKEPLMEVVMGQREEPAFHDIALINRMYCQVSCLNKAELVNVKLWKGYSQTISGRKCQNWGSQTPHAHGYIYKGDDNDCRNDEAWVGGLWCFTTDPDVIYEPCVTTCEDLEAAGIPFCHGYCENGGYHDPNTCQCICPTGFSGDDCSVEEEDSRYAFLPCGGKVPLIPGAPVGIHSPNWPAKYGTDAMCMWWVVVPEGHVAMLNVTTFDIEEGDLTGCYDYLEIRKTICEDASASVDELRYCGKVLNPGDDSYPYSVTSTTQDMVIKFFSDESEVRKGFTGVLHAVPIAA